jgi:hypothetical protein
MDTCNMDCGIHDGCIQRTTGAMRDGLNATGRKVIFYVDDGNDSSGPRVYNPFMRSIQQTRFRLPSLFLFVCFVFIFYLIFIFLSFLIFGRFQ